MKLNWIALAVLALVCASVMTLLITFLSKKGLPLQFVLSGVFGVGTVIFLVQTFMTTRFQFEVSPLSLAIILIVGVISVVANLALFRATIAAPNPGLAIAIFGLQSAMVSLLAFIFLKDKLTVLQLLGMALAILGVSLISLGSSKTKTTETMPTSARVVAKVSE